MSNDPLKELSGGQIKKFYAMGFSEEELKAAGFWSSISRAWDRIKRVAKKVSNAGANIPILGPIAARAVREVRDKIPLVDEVAKVAGFGMDLGLKAGSPEMKKFMTVMRRPMVKGPSKIRGSGLKVAGADGLKASGIKKPRAPRVTRESHGLQATP